MNWKTCFLPLLLAAVMLGSVTAFADGEPVTPETTEPTEITSEETAGSWKDNAYTDNQGIVYEWNENSITVTDTILGFQGGEITIPATIKKGGISYPVTGVGDRAFRDCTALKTVTFSGNIDSIGVEAFSHCNDLENVTFPGNVGSIGSTAFVNCTALENVTFSGDVGSIGTDAFGQCSTLDTVTFSGNVDSIWNHAFYRCHALENVTFSGDVGSIGDSAFWDCIALKTLTFSGDVGNIWDYAFFGCDALKTLTFSGDVDSIGDFAFGDCTTLTMIYVPASMPEETVQIIRDALDSSRLSDVQIVQPEQPSDPDPDTPSDPATDPSTPSVPSTGTPSAPSTGTTSTGSASAVQQLEAAERPDPMDVEANERYNFWMDVKSDLRAAGDGRTVRVYVPADYTNMPASVMETIRTLGKEITIDLRWNGQRLIITPQTALKRPARKAFWTFDALCEVYAR